MRRSAAAGLALALAAGVAAAASLAIPVDEAKVPAGSYYVGKAMGERDYRALANASTPGFLVLKAPVTRALAAVIVAWGRQHGYTFEAECPGCAATGPAAPEQPATALSWRDAALLANALSEADGLDPVYRDAAGQPVRAPAGLDAAIVEPTLSGFRLPTIPEWQIAMRGADKALTSGRYGAAPSAPNPLGLMGATGPVAEWTARTMTLGDGKPASFACNAETDGVRRYSNCELHGAAWSDPSVGFRFVRKLAR